MSDMVITVTEQIYIGIGLASFATGALFGWMKGHIDGYNMAMDSMEDE